jgi:hypothetical protein
MRMPFLLGLLVLPSIVCAQEVGDERRLFGPLRFGMTTAQAQAATPGIDWVVLEGAQDSNVTYSIKASQLLDLGGFRYDVVVGNRYGGSHHWRILSTAASANAAECESRTAALISELERRFGVFDVTAPPSGTEEVVAVGRQSKMKTDAADANMRRLSRAQALKKDAALYFVRARHDSVTDDDVDIVVLADYRSRGARECDIRVEIDGVTPPPAGMDVGFDPARVLARPSISYRNRSLRELGVPAKPLEFLVPCNMQGSTGDVGSCINGPSNQAVDPYRKLASQWALAYRLDTGATDPEDRTMFGIEIPITMGPADVREVDFDDGPVLDVKKVRIVSGDRVSPEGYFPEDPKLARMSADLTVRCKVQEDGSMICGLKPGTASPADAFTRGAVLLAENLEIETRLSDGTSAVGGFIDRRIVFRPASE